MISEGGKGPYRARDGLTTYLLLSDVLCIALRSLGTGGIVADIPEWELRRDAAERDHKLGKSFRLTAAQMTYAVTGRARNYRHRASILIIRTWARS